MKLKSLELHGFKSFAERTVFEFDQGITAVVGPNGCGKSNVVDAVKWALGEQSARSLRGSEMLDVIFNGSERRGPLGMAEVTLNFDNSDGTLPIDCADVAISRRLYRSGESEYLINNRPARLRDIRELFMGTGLGPGGYGFMEQGKIDSVLASNPSDRRRVFEEAAGISKFRARRHETELKLDKVDANLLRLADIIDELERRQRSLKVQAGRARSFQEHNRRLRELQSIAALHAYHRNLRNVSEISEVLEKLTAERGELTAQRDSMRAEIEEVEKELERASEAFSAVRARCAEVAAREKAAAEMVAFHERHLAEIDERASGRATEIDRLNEELEQARAKRREAETELERLQAGLDQLTARVAACEEESARLRSEDERAAEQIRGADRSFQSLQRRRLELEREASRLESESGRCDEEMASAAERAQEAAVEIERIRGEMEELHRTETAQAGRIEDEKSALAESRKELSALEAGAESEAERHRTLLAESSRVTGRVEALERFVERQEGLDEGVRAVLARRDCDPTFLPGFRGLLADLIHVDLDRADAVEAALGELTRAVVVSSAADALAGLQFLAESPRGRAAFLPIEAFAGESGSLPDGLRVDDPALAPVLAALLEGVEIVDETELARRIEAGESLPPVAATRHGGVVRHGRVFVSGRESGRGVLATRAELESLRGRAIELEDEIAAVEAEMAEAAKKVETKRGEVRERENRLLDSEREHARLSQRVDALGQQLERLETEQRRLADACESARQRRSELAAASERTAGLLAEVTRSIADEEEKRDAAQGERDRRRSRLDEAVAALESARLEHATTMERLQGLRETVQYLSEKCESAERSIARYEQELSGFSGDRERSTAILAEESKRAEEFAAAHETAREEIETRERELAAVRSRHEELVSGFRDLEAALEAKAEEVHGAEMRCNEVRVNQENLIEHAREEYEIDLVRLHEDYDPDAEVDGEAVEAEVHELKEKIARLGPVNLTAVHDLEEVEERLEFLTAQRNDLQSSKQQLTRVLGDIEDESTRLFLETFNNVRQLFQVIFRKLFGGGKADIRLLDESNVLESGIEIVARPPGKEMRSISLLSGGERSMTAVALLFAIIRAHPCPCCLLDEVDAALDEDNTERFCKLLDEFVDRTQFLLITHSRRTMARADVLFGVTMGERGVSRHVSVRFEDVGQDGEIKIAAQEPGGGNGAGGNGGASGVKVGGVSPSDGDVIVEMSAAADDPDLGGGATGGRSGGR